MKGLYLFLHVCSWTIEITDDDGSLEREVWNTLVDMSTHLLYALPLDV